MMVYSQDGLGLGHLRRTRNIVRELLARDPHCAALVVADSPAAPFFAPLPGVDYLKLPTVIKTGPATWRVGGLAIDIADAVRLRGELILTAFRQFRPDTVLVDHMPTGAMGELKQLIEAAAGAGARLVLGLRDVLDAPDAVWHAWSEAGAFECLSQYDCVLIYGSREIFDAATAYSLKSFAPRVLFCNYVGPTPDEACDLEDAAAPSEPYVLVTGGGGADLFPLVESYLAALPTVVTHRAITTVILPGPNMPRAQQDLLKARAAHAPVQVHDRCNDTGALFRAASAVVSMGGYNTLVEALHWRKRTLAIPRAGPSAEQRIRTRLFASRELVRAVDPDHLTPHVLAHELLALLQRGDLPRVENIPALNGAAQAAELLIR